MNKNEIAKSFFEVIPQAMHLVRTEVHSTIKPGLSVSQFRVLAKIRRGINHVGQIADLHGVSQPAISKLISAMTAKGLVRKKISRNDRRIFELEMTPKGKSLFEKTRANAMKGLESKLGIINDNQLNQLKNALEYLSQFSQQINKK